MSKKAADYTLCDEETRVVYAGTHIRSNDAGSYVEFDDLIVELPRELRSAPGILGPAIIYVDDLIPGEKIIVLGQNGRLMDLRIGGFSREKYRDETLPSLRIGALLDVLSRATLSNEYGSHDDQIDLIKGEIADRAHAEPDDDDNIVGADYQADTISLDETLISQMFAHGGIDETNAHHAFRSGRRKLREYLDTHRERGVDDETAFSTQLDFETVDSIIISATRNGGEDLFGMKR